MDTDSYIVYINTDDIYKDIAEEKGTKICAIERELKIENYKDCLEAIQVYNEISY